MPRTVQEILDHADELAQRFETYEPAAADERDVQAFTALRAAAMSRSHAERSVTDAVARARESGHSWAFIGSVLGTSGEAARQRYGSRQQAAGLSAPVRRSSRPPSKRRPCQATDVYRWDTRRARLWRICPN